MVAGMVGTLVRAGVLAPLRPDRYVHMVIAARRGGSVTLGFALAAGRCPDRAGLIDEIGPLTWRQLDARCDALAAALQELGAEAGPIGIMCRNHRGFVTALVAADRVGADILLLNTSFAGPALAQVVEREGLGTIRLRRRVHRDRRPRVGEKP